MSPRVAPCRQLAPLVAPTPLSSVPGHPFPGPWTKTFMFPIDACRLAVLGWAPARARARARPPSPCGLLRPRVPGKTKNRFFVVISGYRDPRISTIQDIDNPRISTIPGHALGKSTRLHYLSKKSPFGHQDDTSSQLTYNGKSIVNQLSRTSLIPPGHLLTIELQL